MARRRSRHKDYRRRPSITGRRCAWPKDPLQKTKIEDAMMQCEVQPMYDEFNDAIAAEKDGGRKSRRKNTPTG